MKHYKTATLEEIIKEHENQDTTLDFSKKKAQTAQIVKEGDSDDEDYDPEKAMTEQVNADWDDEENYIPEGQ